MTVTRDDAIRLATDHVNANGYRVVPGFDGIPWCDDPRPVTLARALRIDGEWAVLFDKMLPPWVEAECPGDTCVVVSDEGGCRFYPML